MTYSETVEAYAAYRNSAIRAREHYEPDELKAFEQDMNKARAAMERAWLDEIPTQERS